MKREEGDLQMVVLWRKQVQAARRRLQRWAKHYKPEGKQTHQVDPVMWGEKDSYLSALARLVQLDLKLMGEEEVLRKRGGIKSAALEALDESAKEGLSRKEWEMLAEACAEELSRSDGDAQR